MTEAPLSCRDPRRDLPNRGVPSLIFQLVRHLATALDRRLAPALGTDAAGVTRLLDRLEAKGLVVRRPNPADRRAIVIEPTDAGRALVPQLIPAFGDVTNLLLANVSAEEAAGAHTMRGALGRDILANEMKRHCARQ